MYTANMQTHSNPSQRMIPQNNQLPPQNNQLPPQYYNPQVMAMQNTYQQTTAIMQPNLLNIVGSRGAVNPNVPISQPSPPPMLQHNQPQETKTKEPKQPKKIKKNVKVINVQKNLL